MVEVTSCGQWVRRARKGLDLTQAALAQQVGCATVTIRKIERDERRPSRQLAELLAEHLKIPDAEQDAFVRLARGQFVPDAAFSPRPIHLREAAAQTPLHNLPEQFTSFVGRETELVTITARLRDENCWLLTLVGPGGIGKTRLALEAGRQLLDDFPHGVFFVSLAALDAADELVPAIAGAVGFSFYSGDTSPQEQLLRYLRGKELLLILDNFEHLRREGAGLLVEMMRETRGLTLLVTSRERLNLQAEWVLPVHGLRYATADANASAVALFLDRSRQVQPTDGNEADLAAVAHICRLVDGMPLAIELAAAHRSVLSPADIAAELADSLDLLATTAPDVPARHRSIRAVFDTMWRRLAAPEQRTLRQFSVFRGGCDHEAAEKVASATLPVLMALVHKSALRYRDPDSGRFEIHELLRQYAAEQLDAKSEERDAVQARHARYYTTFLHRRESDVKGARQRQALTEIETEHDNVRAAWAWAVAAGKSTLLDRAMEGLGRFYQRRSRFKEGESLIRGALEHLEATSGFETRVMANALAWHGYFTYELGEIEVATRSLQRSLNLLDPFPQPDADADLLRAFVLGILGRTVLHSDREAAQHLLTRSLALYRRHTDRWGEAEALRWLGHVAWNVGRYDEAETFVRESLSASEAIGDEVGLAGSLAILAFVIKHQGEFEAAEQMQRRSLAIYRRAGDFWGAVFVETDLAFTLIWLGEFSEARQLLEGSLSVYQEIGSIRVAFALTGLGLVTRHLGEYGAARAYQQECLRRSEEMDDRRGMGFAYHNLGPLALAEENYTEAEQVLQSALSTFREIDQRVFEGNTLAKLACVTRATGEHSQAQQYVIEALHIVDDIRDVAPLFDALPAAALLFADRGEPVRAVELYAFATHRFGIVRKSRYFADVAGRHIEAVKATLPAEVVAAAEERGRARDLWQTVAELLEELPQRG